jgi:type II secretory pathway pseudopilin PulG
VNLKFQISNFEFRIEKRKAAAFFPFGIRRSQFAIRGAFTLIEVMVVVVLLSLIVIALMGVFNSTQAAFRASITQTDVLEGGRAAMDLMAGDLKEMSPSLGFSNLVANGGVNFFVTNNDSTYSPLIQPLVASSSSRMNVLQKFFILSHENQTWSGVGYVVDTSPTANGINPLYRFVPTDLPARPDPWQLFTNFIDHSALPISQSDTNMHRLMDGVVTLRVRAYDLNGLWMTNGYSNPASFTVKNVRFLPTIFGEVGFYMFNNALPASVEIEMATLEDRTLQRAGTYPNNTFAQSNYLAGQAGKVHVFRQRVAIPNVDSAAY